MQKSIDAEEFETRLASSPWLIACFTRPNCPWCEKISPELGRLAQLLRGKADVVFLDRDRTPELAARFSVKSFPVLILFKNGSIREAAAGGGEAAMDWIKSLEELAEA